MELVDILMWEGEPEVLPVPVLLLPLMCECGDWTRWRIPCRRCCSEMDGSWRVPLGHRDSADAAGGSTVG